MGADLSKEEPKKLQGETEPESEHEDCFEEVGRYHGSFKGGKRQGQGVYYYDNGDIYDGEWRKGRKEGYGKYVFADGKKNIGWFYRDTFVGKEPNDKLRRKMKKKNITFDEAKSLPDKDPSADESPTSPTDPPVNDNDSDEDNTPKLKDPSGLELRRAESMRRQEYFRAKYNIHDKNEPKVIEKDSGGKRGSIRAKFGLKRSKSSNDTKSHKKDPRLLTKEEELLERQNSKKQRASIRARYNLQ